MKRQITKLVVTGISVKRLQWVIGERLSDTQYVTEILSYGQGSYTVRLSDGTFYDYPFTSVLFVQGKEIEDHE